MLHLRSHNVCAETIRNDMGVETESTVVKTSDLRTYIFTTNESPNESVKHLR